MSMCRITDVGGEAEERTRWIEQIERYSVSDHVPLPSHTNILVMVSYTDRSFTAIMNFATFNITV